MVSRLATALLLVAVAFVGSAKAGGTQNQSKAQTKFLIPYTVCCEDGKLVVKVLACKMDQCPNPNDGSEVVTYWPLSENVNLKPNGLDAIQQSFVDAWENLELSTTDVVADKIEDITSQTGMICKSFAPAKTPWVQNLNRPKKDKKVTVCFVRVACQPAKDICKKLQSYGDVGALKNKVTLSCEWVKVADLLSDECGDDVADISTYQTTGETTVQAVPNGKTFYDLVCNSDVRLILEQIAKVLHDGAVCGFPCDFKTDEEKADALVAMVDQLNKTKVQQLAFESKIKDCKNGNITMKFDGEVCLCRELVLCCKRWKLSFKSQQDQNNFIKAMNCIRDESLGCTFTQDVRNASKDGKITVVFMPTDDENVFDGVVTTTACTDCEGLPITVMSNFTLESVEDMSKKN